MKKMFSPDSVAVVGLSLKDNNIPRLTLENLLRWGYRGRIYGVNPRNTDPYVDGVRMFENIEDLPEVPDLAYCLIPARFVPEMVERCGRLGIKRMAIPSGGFSEFSAEGGDLARQTLELARKYGVRFVGPNCLTIASTATGLCLPFFPVRKPPVGGVSIISQSGGVALTIMNYLHEENLGMAKFASIGNKLDLDEVDFLEYFGADPETEVICMYLESISRGRDLINAASRIDKPVVIYKASNTGAGRKAAMSHTAAVSNDNDIMDAAFERAGIIRVRNYHDLFAVAKSFKLPPMRGKRLMVMSPAGGFAVMAADLCEKAGFEFADPGEEFYRSLKDFSNAGVIRFSNPIDMGDIYDPQMTAHVISSVMHSDKVDGALFLTQRPDMPSGNDIFHRMFLTDLSNETLGSILSSGKPLGISIIGPNRTMVKIKQQTNFPIFNGPEELVRAMQFQMDYYRHRQENPESLGNPDGIDLEAARIWLDGRKDDYGEESLDLLSAFDIPCARSLEAADSETAAAAAAKIGFPLVMKVVSPDALHKTEVGGVLTGIADEAAARAAFGTIEKNLAEHRPVAAFKGVRLQEMAGEGYDMFVGGKYDESFGPVVFFGMGGIYVEVFRDVACAICPAGEAEIRSRLEQLRCFAILSGSRGKTAGDVDAFVDVVMRVSRLMAAFPAIKELDINPVRIFTDGALALDARIRIEC